MENKTLKWKVERGVTNGVKHSFYSAKSWIEGVGACIFKDSSHTFAILSVNGYQFLHTSVKEAKADAEDRLKCNRGIYLHK